MKIKVIHTFIGLFLSFGLISTTVSALTQDNISIRAAIDIGMGGPHIRKDEIKSVGNLQLS